MYTFEEIIGYNDIKEHIQNSIKLKKLTHAYIIDGPEGSGKKTIANTIAKTLQCENGQINPCNNCISCKTFDTTNHPDVIYIKPTNKKSIGIEDVREQIQNNIDIKPYKYDYKIYIVDDAHTLTEQAQNALLKTIEEPPSYAIIILLSKNSSSFLPTILSRCVKLTLRPLTNKEIKNYLTKKLEIPDYQAKIYSAFSHGTIGMAKKLATSEEFNVMREDIIELLQNINTSNNVETMELYKTFEKYKDQVSEVLDLLYIWYRDMLFIKQFGDNEYIINKDKIQIIEHEGTRVTEKKIIMNLQNINETKQKLLRNTNFQLTIEMLLLKLK